MTAELQTTLWGVAVMIPVVLNIATKRDADALGISAMILLIWTISRVFWALYTPPESMAWYPVIDSLAAGTCLTAWVTIRRWWKLALVVLFTTQCVLHAAFWLTWPEYQSLLRYVVANNILFALELLCVAAPGGSHVARDLVSRMPDRLGRFHHARP